MKAGHFVFLVILLAVPTGLRAGEMFNIDPTGSVTESKKRGFFVEELAVSPKEVVYQGQTIRIEEAWSEQRFRTENFLLLFQRRRRTKGHWLCVRMAAPTAIAFRDPSNFPALRCEGSRMQWLFTHYGDASKDPILCFSLDALLESYRIQIAKDFQAPFEAFVSAGRPRQQR